MACVNVFCFLISLSHLITSTTILYSDGIVPKCLGSINNCFLVANVLKYQNIFIFLSFQNPSVFLKPGVLWDYGLGLWLFFTVVP